jgi:hypothetical protein
VRFKLALVLALVILSIASVVNAQELVYSTAIPHPDCLIQCTVDVSTVTQNLGEDFLLYIGINEHGVNIYIFDNYDSTQGNVLVAGYVHFSYAYLYVEAIEVVLNLEDGSIFKITYNKTREQFSSEGGDYYTVNSRVLYVTIRGITRISERDSPPPLSDFWGWIEYLARLFYSLLDLLKYGVFLLVTLLSMLATVFQLFVFFIVFGFVAVLISNPLNLPGYINLVLDIGHKSVDIVIRIVKAVAKFFHIIVDLIGHAVPA